jgi:hypothetical protein
LRFVRALHSWKKRTLIVARFYTRHIFLFFSFLLTLSIFRADVVSRETTEDLLREITEQAPRAPFARNKEGISELGNFMAHPNNGTVVVFTAERMKKPTEEELAAWSEDNSTSSSNPTPSRARSIPSAVAAGKIFRVPTNVFKGVMVIANIEFDARLTFQPGEPHSAHVA